MSTKIQWTDETWNPWQGCKKVSQGCKYCYMYRDKLRHGQTPDVVVKSKSPTFRKPLSWKEPRRIFASSWTDFFIEDADEWRGDAWDIIRRCPQHTWQILTKRPENIKDRLPPDWGEGWPNVWLGVSVENIRNAHRIYTLEEVPAKVRFVSAEPLIGQLSMQSHVWSGIDWVIIGGESGNDNGLYRYRPCSQLWIEMLVNDLKNAGVAVFVKQLGTDLAKTLKLKDRHGGDWDEWPESLKVREFPK